MLRWWDDDFFFFWEKCKDLDIYTCVIWIKIERLEKLFIFAVKKERDDVYNEYQECVNIDLKVGFELFSFFFWKVVGSLKKSKRRGWKKKFFLRVKWIYLKSTNEKKKWIPYQLPCACYYELSKKQFPYTSTRAFLSTREKKKKSHRRAEKPTLSFVDATLLELNDVRIYEDHPINGFIGSERKRYEKKSISAIAKKKREAYSFIKRREREHPDRSIFAPLGISS